MIEAFLVFGSYVAFVGRGLGVTLLYSSVPVILGFSLGVFLALMRLRAHSVIKSFVALYVSVFRGTPLLVQLSLMYYGVNSLSSFKLAPIAAGIIAFSLNSAAYVSEIIRGGILGVDKGQFEAAQALSIPYWYMMRDIILPQALRKILPALVSESINLVKESAIISTIGVVDITRRATVLASEHFTYFGPMMVAALWYYVIVLCLSSFGRWLEGYLAYQEQL